jgi:hypothetical protein
MGLVDVGIKDCVRTKMDEFLYGHSTPLFASHLQYEQFFDHEAKEIGIYF